MHYSVPYADSEAITRQLRQLLDGAKTHDREVADDEALRAIEVGEEALRQTELEAEEERDLAEGDRIATDSRNQALFPWMNDALGRPSRNAVSGDLPRQTASAGPHYPLSRFSQTIVRETSPLRPRRSRLLCNATGENNDVTNSPNCDTRAPESGDGRASKAIALAITTHEPDACAYPLRTSAPRMRARRR